MQNYENTLIHATRCGVIYGAETGFSQTRLNPYFQAFSRKRARQTAFAFAARMQAESQADALISLPRKGLLLSLQIQNKT